MASAIISRAVADIGEDPTISKIIRVYKYLSAALGKAAASERSKHGYKYDVTDYKMPTDPTLARKLLRVMDKIAIAIDSNTVTRHTPELSVILWLEAASMARRALRLPKNTNMSKHDKYYIAALQIYKRLRLRRSLGLQRYLHPSDSSVRLSSVYFIVRNREDVDRVHPSGVPSFADCRSILVRKQTQDPFIWDRAASDMLGTHYTNPRWNTPTTFLKAINRRYNDLHAHIDRMEWRRTAAGIALFQEKRRAGRVPPMNGPGQVHMAHLPANLLLRTIADFVGPRDPRQGSAPSVRTIPHGRPPRALGSSISAVMRRSSPKKPAPRRVKSNASARKRSAPRRVKAKSM